jgi:hypothetical protein
METRPMQYPPPDQSAERLEAASALLAAIREVRDANERLQVAAAWVLEAFGDTADAETIRMLPIGPARPGRPAVPPPARSATMTDLADLDPMLREPLTGPDSVTVTERCWCGHLEVDHIDTACQVGTCQCGGFDDEGLRR